MGRPAVVRSALAAALFLGLFAAVYGSLVQTVPGQRWDNLSLGVGGRYASRGLGTLAAAWRTALAPVLGLAGLGLLVLAVRRARRRAALTGIALMGGSLAVGEVIKALLPRPYFGHFGYPVNTLPSVHAITSTAVLLALLLVAPERARRWPVVLLAWLLAVPLAFTSVLTQSHLLSDVLCGVLLTGAGAAVAGVVAGRSVVPAVGRWLGPVVPIALLLGVVAGRSGSLPLIGIGQLLLTAAAAAAVFAVLATLSPRPAPTPR